MSEQEFEKRTETAETAAALAHKIGKNGFDVVYALGVAFAAGLACRDGKPAPEKEKEEK